MREADINLGVGIILGLGGVKNSESHVEGSIRVLNELYASDIGLTVLMPQERTALYQDMQSGTFEAPTYGQILREELEILKGLQLKRDTTIRTGVALPLSPMLVGSLPNGKEKLIKQVENRNNHYSEHFNTKVRANGLL